MIDKNKRFLFTYRVISVLGLCGAAGFLFSLPNKNIYVLLLNNVLFGAALVPVQPIGYSFSIELSHPVSEAMSNGVIMLCGQLVGFLITYIGTELTKHNAAYCIYLFMGQAVFAIIINFFIVEDLRRVQIAKNRKGSLKQERLLEREDQS